jgi:hypothetical protein
LNSQGEGVTLYRTFFSKSLSGDYELTGLNALAMLRVEAILAVPVVTLPRFLRPHNVTGAAICANLLENLSPQHLFVEIDCLVVSDAGDFSQNAVGHELMSFQVVESDVSDVD